MFDTAYIESLLSVVNAASVKRHPRDTVVGDLDRLIDVIEV